MAEKTMKVEDVIAEALAERESDDCFSQDVELPGYADVRAMSRSAYREEAREALSALADAGYVVLDKEEAEIIARELNGFEYKWARIKLRGGRDSE